MIPLSISKPRAIIIPLIEVWCNGRPIILQPNKTSETENGKIAVTTMAERSPKKNKLKDNTKNVAKAKL